MVPFILIRRVMTLGAATILSACASLHPSTSFQPSAYVVVGDGGAAVARVLTSADTCPSITLDQRVLPMRVRAPLAPIPSGRHAGHRGPSSPVLTCELPIPAGTAQASVAGQTLPLPHAVIKRIVVIGDTGCRIKGLEAQDCNDPHAYPFATVAASAARFKPDLVVHVGDYHYREDPCPAGRTGCARSPWGYGWDAWNADFFTPGRALLQAAPWVMARGNHESCARAGQGYWRFLDPRPLLSGRDCDDRANDAIGDYSDPYAVPLGDGAQLIVFDTANTSYKGFKPGDPRTAIYADTLRKITALAARASYNIAVDHHPLFAFGALENALTRKVSLYGGDAGLLQAFGSVDPTILPPTISMVLSGHEHLWEQISFASGQPTQFVSGFAGTLEDIVPLPAVAPPGLTPAPGAVVEHMSSWIDGFGYMTMERTGPKSWQVKVWDRDGRERNRCAVQGRRSQCDVVQVKSRP
jgi:hypothetical protein